MRHLLLCRELPPAPGGGIGSYTERIAELLAERGEIVHVIAQRWNGAEKPLERRNHGRLVIHRVPCERPGSPLGRRSHRGLGGAEERALFRSAYFPQAFAWSAGLLAERLTESEGIDVIEAPEYEAPLYFFQLRRALGLGPPAKMPCIVHLHSPTEIIARNNDWDLGHPYFLTAKRLEDFSMSCADALLCPSHYLADEIASRKDLGCPSVRVMHYPAPRWESSGVVSGPRPDGSIVHVGRLERRKGSLEWLDAAVAAARLHPEVRFEFVGRAVLNTDWQHGDVVVRDRIPADVRSQFRFHGQKDAAGVRDVLRRARFVVVPSRWDNFPNTCIEAMTLGLPVLATRSGGMPQLVEDASTGWLCESSDTAGLYRGLMRAVATPAAKLEEMGRAARRIVLERCDPEGIVDAHLEFKRELTRQGARRSLELQYASRARWLATSGRESAAQTRGSRIGAAVVCSLHARPQLCLEALARQSVRPAVTVLAFYDAAGADARPPAAYDGIDLLTGPQPDRASAIRAAVAALNRAEPPLDGMVLLDEHDLLYPQHIARCAEVLKHCPDVGLVSFWEGPPDRPVIRSCPTRPYQWSWNDAAAAAVYRFGALERWDGLPTLEDPRYERWYLANAALACGWAGVTIPEVLAERHAPDGQVDRLDSTRMVQAIWAPFAREIAQDAAALLLLTRSGSGGSLRDRHFRPREFSELAMSLASDWRRAVKWGWQRIRQRLDRG